VALSLTLGIIADRNWIVPLPASLSIGLVCFLGWLIVANSPRKWLALVCLWISVASLGCAYHHWRRHMLDASDLSHFLDQDPQPTRLRGTLHTAPIARINANESLPGLPAKDTTRFVLRVSHRQDLATRNWFPASGLTQVTLTGRTQDITIGDEIELLGRLALPNGAMNAGELDFASFLRDQGITTTLVALESEDLTVTRRGWPTSIFGCLAVLRGWGQRTLERDLSSHHDVASALLLGEGSAMTGEAWEQYRRTGVIHVLAISGQHLVVLAGFLWLLARTCRVRRRRAALLIALILIAYALLTGGRPPVMRAAFVVASFVGAILLQRPMSHANTIALGWTGVIAINPTDIFGGGCQLSFLAVTVLIFCVARWYDEPADPLDRLMDESRPWHARVVRWLGRWLSVPFLLNAAVWMSIWPLVASHYNVVSPIALVLGPPMVLLTSIALLSGFVFFLMVGWCAPLAWPFALITQTCLVGCEALVSLGQKIPCAYFFVPNIPTWWLWIYYLGLLVGITVPKARMHFRKALLVGVAWLVLLMVLITWPHRPGELRCAFIAVGHGGCTVIETPNGGVIVYDAGATGGAEVTRRSIAPYLWSRGIRRIDLLLLSHADLDHFNGVPQLAERFAIGRAITTPTFAERGGKEMQRAIAALESLGVALEIAHRGQRLEVDGVSIEVLHPPAVGPDGIENVRSLVLHVTHGEWSMLLTGDLEDAGLAQVLQMPRRKVDVLMAPHHGSDRSNIPAFANWARPKLVVSSQSIPKGDRVSVPMYEKMGAKYLSTWPHGTITIRPKADAQVETYRTKLAMRLF